MLHKVSQTAHQINITIEALFHSLLLLAAPNVQTWVEHQEVVVLKVLESVVHVSKLITDDAIIYTHILLNPMIKIVKYF